jgi:hypothetical protein
MFVVGLVFGALLLFTAQLAAAAPAEKVGVCHLTDSDPAQYEYLEIPAQQFEPTKKGRLKGHARHAALGLDILGLSEEDCLARNQGV